MKIYIYIYNGVVYRQGEEEGGFEFDYVDRRLRCSTATADDEVSIYGRLYEAKDEATVYGQPCVPWKQKKHRVRGTRVAGTRTSTVKHK